MVEDRPARLARAKAVVIPTTVEVPSNRALSHVNSDFLGATLLSTVESGSFV
jgi:hypothetical protein